MSADLSYLFRETAPAGTMAGMQQGISNAKTLMDLDKMGVDTATSEFNLDKSRQTLPYDLQKLKAEAAIKEHEASTEMLQNKFRKEQSAASLGEANAEEAWTKLDTTKQTEAINQWRGMMGHILDQAVLMGSNGTNGDTIYSYISDNIMSREDLDPKIKMQWENMRGWFNNQTGQSLAQQASKMKETLFNTSNEAFLENIKGSWQERLHKIDAAARVDTANIEKPPKLYNPATVLGDLNVKKATLAAKMRQMRQNSPELKQAFAELSTINSQISALENQLRTFGSTTETTGVGGQTFTKNKEVGLPGNNKPNVIRYDSQGNRIK